MKTQALTYSVARHPQNLPQELSILIHIRNVGEGAAIPSNKYQTVVYSIEFDDITADVGETTRETLGREPVLFTQEMAGEIARLIHGSRDINNIIVVCPAGLSRSAGIAAAIDTFFNKDCSQYMPSKGYYPNPLVHRLMLQALEEQKED